MSKYSSQSRAKTLSIGGATYDLFLIMKEQSERNGEIILRGGEKILVDHVVETCGGGACNTSIGLSRLGCEASFCGVLGTDQWGTRMLETMQTEKVQTESAIIVENETSSFSIIVNLSSGERSILASQGTSEHLRDATFDKSAIASMDWVYLNHLCESACEIENDLLDMLQNQTSTHLTWNPGGCQIAAGIDDPMKRSLLERTNLLVLNKEEALMFTRTQSQEDALKQLKACGTKNICITDGKNGVLATDGKTTFRCPVVPEITIVDTTGAGDAFGTGVTWSLLHGATLPDAVIAGTLNATSVLKTVGAQDGLLTEDALLQKLKTHSLHVVTVTD